MVRGCHLLTPVVVKCLLRSSPSASCGDRLRLFWFHFVSLSPSIRGWQAGVPAGRNISTCISLCAGHSTDCSQSATAASAVIRRLLYCNRVRTFQIRWGGLPTPNYSGQVSHFLWTVCPVIRSRKNYNRMKLCTFQKYRFCCQMRIQQ